MAEYNHPRAAPSTDLGDWSVAADQTLTRPMNLLETWFRDVFSGPKVPNREAKAIMTRVKLKFPGYIAEPTLYVRRAWVVAWILHPNLAAEYPRSGSSLMEHDYIRITPKSPEEWLEASFAVHEGDTAMFRSAEDVAKHFSPWKTALAHWIPGTSEFILCTSHLGTDGTGLMKFIHRYLKCLASAIQLGLVADIESYPSIPNQPALNPGIGQVLALNSQEPVPFHVAKAVESLIATCEESGPILSLPLKAGSEHATPGPTIRLGLTIDEITSELIRRVCVDRRISIAAAVHSCLVSVVASHPQHPEAKNTLTGLTVDLRRILPPRYLEEDCAVGLFTFVIPFCIPDVTGSQTFDQLTKRFGAMYASDLLKFTTDDDGRPVSVVEILPAYLNELVRLSRENPLALPPRPSPTVSSIGLVEKFLKREYACGPNNDDKLEVEDHWFSLDTIGTSAGFYVWTFRDKIRLQVCFNESYFDTDIMNTILQNMKERLTEGLGIRKKDSKL